MHPRKKCVCVCVCVWGGGVAENQRPPWRFERKSTLEKAEINQILIIKFKNIFRKISR
jgi:hypothetical protein